MVPHWLRLTAPRGKAPASKWGVKNRRLKAAFWVFWCQLMPFAVIKACRPAIVSLRHLRILTPAAHLTPDETGDQQRGDKCGRSERQLTAAWQRLEGLLRLSRQQAWDAFGRAGGSAQGIPAGKAGGRPLKACCGQITAADLRLQTAGREPVAAGQPFLQ